MVDSSQEIPNLNICAFIYIAYQYSREIFSTHHQIFSDRINFDMKCPTINWDSLTLVPYLGQKPIKIEKKNSSQYVSRQHRTSHKCVSYKIVNNS